MVLICKNYFNLNKALTLSKGYKNIFKQYQLQSFRNKGDESKIRTLGIIAHIDAGKTTTIERMLYYSGFTNYMGEVHDGDTIMDYLPQERQRGITITSAAISFNWKKHKINLIDTPGHFDFTFEVERSLSVLDGSVTILDASEGVQVQTLKVWNQAKKYKVPCIVYLNKMDKPTADVNLCLDSLSQKLKVYPLMLHHPLEPGKNFHGIVDILTKNKYIWNISNKEDKGFHFKTEKIDPNNDPDLFLCISKKHEKLIENLAEFDDLVAEKYINDGYESLTEHELNMALRRITLKRVAVPVLCGSSYKNVGVQLLMDAILNYLPFPSEINDSNYGNDFSALVFKIIHNINKEPLAFLRIYSGDIKKGQKVYNINQKISEKINKLMIPLANNFKEVSSLSSGNIAIVQGLKQVITGDTLLSATSCLRQESNKLESALYHIQVPEPIYFCTIEPPSLAFQKKLDFALTCLQREDPTFQVIFDEDIGQTILKGMGVLHIEIIKERIKTEYGIDAYLGPLQIAYRETIENVIEYTHILDKLLGGNKHYVKISLRLYPNNISPKEIKVIVTKDNELGKIRSDYLKALNKGMQNALKNGPISSFPIINIGVDLLWLEVGKSTSLTMLSAAIMQCISLALHHSNSSLLEPIMKLTITVNEGYAGRVLKNLSQKRSSILDMELRQDIHIISSLTPLAELKDYSTELNALTSGTSSFTLEFDSYQKVDREEQLKVMQILKGI